MKFKEKLLEDYLEQHPGEAFPPFDRIPDYHLDWHWETIGRQVKCEGGIIDLLVRSWNPEYPENGSHIYVYELKGVPGKRQDKEQVNRYVEAVKDAIWKAVRPEQRRAWQKYDWHGDMDILLNSFEPWVSGLLIAPGGVADVVVEKTEDGFSFRWDKVSKPTFDNSELIRIIRPHVVDNFMIAVGQDLGRTITSGMTGSRKVKVWTN